MALAKAAAGSVYTLEQLRKGCPEGVKASEKEQHLTDAEFKIAFGMSKDEFNLLPNYLFIPSPYTSMPLSLYPAPPHPILQCPPSCDVVV